MPTEISSNNGVERQEANSVNELSQLIRLDKPSNIVKSLEAWYASDFERRVTEITELLQVQIAQQMREQFVAEMEAERESLRTEYEERMDSQLEKWESDRKAMQQEMESLRQQQVLDIRAEIESAESRVREKEAELKRMMCDDSLPLGSIMEGKVERAELIGYLKALNFRSAGSGKRQGAS